MDKHTEKIWMDGHIVPWEDANVHVTAHSIHYGTALFEGINFYECKDGRSAIFRLNSHVHRLFRSAEILGFIKIPFLKNEIEEAIVETVKANGLKEGYIRPLVIIGAGSIGPLPMGNPVHLALIIYERLTGYFGKNAIEKGVSVKFSKWRRDERIMPFHAKAAGNYLNSALAKLEAKSSGFDEAIVLSGGGHLAEGSAANIFVIKDGILMTPHWKLPILGGITKDTVITLGLNELALKVEETFLNTESLYEADEVFFTGTSAEITPIRDIEEHLIGKECPGPITKKLQQLYFKVVRGELPRYNFWLTYI